MADQSTPAHPSYAWAALAKDGTVIVASVAADRDVTVYAVEHMRPRPRIIRVRLEPVAAVEAHVHDR
jgi:hypothetical protein